MGYLESITDPAGVKALAREHLPALAEEIRREIIATTSENGGHIGPNLGVVELTIALHRVFDTPRDSLVFDVAHQGYVHKLLTGRQGERFRRIRQDGGYSGFLAREESPHDAYGAGHAGTALSAALGMAAARDLRGSGEHVIAVCGDAALTCGITMEALNNVAVTTDRLTIVINDNKWSIDRNVGSIAKYLNELITNPVYNRLHEDLHDLLSKLPGGESILRLGSRAKREAKDFLVPSSLFEKYGCRYIGPVDGHDLDTLIEYLEFCRDSQEPVVLHVLTEKGRGFPPSLEDPETFHGASPFDAETGKSKSKSAGSPPKYQDVLGRALVRFAKEDSRVVGITGAMPSGTGLKFLRDELPGQYFDVGIAEEHAVLFACGLATQDVHPVVAIYSTFLQRAYDPIIHDACLQGLPIVFCMDRAGLSPNDGATHHGLFDIAYLRCVPGLILMQPRDEDQLTDMLWTALGETGPVFIRYPRGAAEGVSIKEQPERIQIGCAERMREGEEIAIWALGPFVGEALAHAQRLQREEGISAAVFDARFVKPLDRERILASAGGSGLVVTMEDGVVSGGFGSAVLELLADEGIAVPVLRIGWPDRFVPHGSGVAGLREAHGLSPDENYRCILTRFRSIAGLLPAER